MAFWHNLLQKLGLARQPEPSPVHAALLATATQAITQATPVTLADQALSDESILVFDLETSGLNTQEDVLLAIGAVTLTNGAISLGHVFECVLAAQADLASESQLIHGLTQQDLYDGALPRTGLLEFLNYGSNRIWIAYHAEFDRIMLQRATQDWLGIGFDAQPLDAAILAPMLFPETSSTQQPLDYWLKTFGLTASVRHNALADAMATAELLLILLDRAHRLGYQTWGELGQACKDWQQLQRHLP